MKVVLLKDIKGVGRRFEEKNVSDGHAMNFLFPKNLALVADKAGLRKVNQLKEQGEAKKAVVEKEISDKEQKRLEKHLELEKFRQQAKRA